jgi:hypothetical protein
LDGGGDDVSEPGKYIDSTAPPNSGRRTEFDASACRHQQGCDEAPRLEAGRRASGLHLLHAPDSQGLDHLSATAVEPAAQFFEELHPAIRSLFL